MYSNPTQSIDVHSVQSSISPNGNQQPGRNKKKGRNNNRNSGKNNNKSKDNSNNERMNNNVGEGKKEMCKVKFSCKLCKDDHLTHLCPILAESMRLVYLQPVVLTNTFPHNQHMASISSNVRNVASGSKTPLTQDDVYLCINMVKS
jgi:hypothetical protein